MEVLIAGDYCPQSRISQLIEQKEYKQIFDGVRNMIKEVDYSIVNLECPITLGPARQIEKCGPTLSCSENGVEALKWVGFNCVTLANNHILDYGEEGIKSTMEICKKYGMDTVGGGNNLEDASRVLYREIKGEKLAIINCCEHEFSIAQENCSGSNPLNPIKQYYDIIDAKRKATYVVVIVHGGNEYYEFPSPRMKETYRFFIDAGADIVVNHHQHCYSGYEFYNGKPIVYGLGNFCFDNPSLVGGGWNRGYMVCVSLREKVSIRLLPYDQCSLIPEVRPLDDKEMLLFHNDIQRINGIIADDIMLKEKYQSFLNGCESIMRTVFSPYSSKIAVGLCRRHMIPSFITKKKKLALRSYIQCESHLSKVIHFLTD